MYESLRFYFCFLFLKLHLNIYTLLFSSDIGECNGNPCHVNADCTNTVGGFTCTCKVGYTGNGLTACNGELSGLVYV